MTMGSALAAWLSAETDEQRKAASDEFVKAKNSLVNEMESLGCKVTFGNIEPESEKPRREKYDP